MNYKEMVNCHVASILFFVFFFIYIQHLVNVRSYDYWTTVFESGVITQQISSVVIFIAIFIYLQNNIMSGHHLIWTGSLSTGIGYIFWDLIMLKTRNNYEFKRKIIECIQALYLFISLYRSASGQKRIFFLHYLIRIVTHIKDLDKSNKPRYYLGAYCYLLSYKCTIS